MLNITSQRLFHLTDTLLDNLALLGRYFGLKVKQLMSPGSCGRHWIVEVTPTG